MGKPVTSCPFCSGDPEWVSKANNLGNHICMNCGAMHKGDLTWDESAALWNTRPVKKGHGKHSFEASPFFDFERFRSQFPKWGLTKITLYYDKAVGYSGANGGKYLDWVRAVKNWERTDKEKAGPIDSVNSKLQDQKWEAPKVDNPASKEDVLNALKDSGI